MSHGSKQQLEELAERIGLGRGTIACRGTSTNLLGIPTSVLASALFNDHPVPLRIAGVRETSRGLFHQLENRAETAPQAAEIFDDYMSIVYGLDPRMRRKPDKDGRRLFRSSFGRLLKGWLFDSNSPEGAVLKGWVESRFGLFPTFHKEPIREFASEAWVTYVEEKMSSRFHNNSIYTQLDLLFEFCQFVLPRFFFPEKTHLTLYRGTNDYSEHPIIERLDKRNVVLRLNNLVSFSAERDIAEGFGDYILETQVPLVKILYFKELLPQQAFKGEGEFLVIGGDFTVNVSYF